VDASQRGSSSNAAAACDKTTMLTTTIIGCRGCRAHAINSRQCTLYAGCNGGGPFASHLTPCRSPAVTTSS
jgi:hypothetical protein